MIKHERLLLLILSALLVGCALGACSMTRWAEIESGTYVVIDGGGGSDQAAMRPIRRLEIDQDAHIAVFALAGDSETVIPFVPRERTEWPAGCPSNIGSTRMEVLDLGVDALTIASTTFDSPILVRACPPDPVRIVLRQDGEIGGAGGACIWPSECVFFGLDPNP
jgi:hypothetical protein